HGYHLDPDAAAVFRIRKDRKRGPGKSPRLHVSRQIDQVTPEAARNHFGGVVVHEYLFLGSKRRGDWLAPSHREHEQDRPDHATYGKQRTHQLYANEVVLTACAIFTMARTVNSRPASQSRKAASCSVSTVSTERECAFGAIPDHSGTVPSPGSFGSSSVHV